MNYYDEIDPIGMSNPFENEEEIDKEHDMICDYDSELKELKHTINNIKKEVEYFKTYSENIFHINKMNNYVIRLENIHKELKSKWVDYTLFKA